MDAAVIPWKPLEQTSRSHCLETCAAVLTGRDEPFVLPRKHDCRWLDLQVLLRREFKVELRQTPLKVRAQRGTPRFGGRAFIAFVSDPDFGGRHCAIAQRDETGALTIVHDGAKPRPADAYDVSHLVRVEQTHSNYVYEPLDRDARCEDNCKSCVWFAY